MIIRYPDEGWFFCYCQVLSGRAAPVGRGRRNTPSSRPEPRGSRWRRGVSTFILSGSAFNGSTAGASNGSGSQTRSLSLPNLFPSTLTNHRPTSGDVSTSAPAAAAAATTAATDVAKPSVHTKAMPQEDQRNGHEGENVAEEL